MVKLSVKVRSYNLIYDVKHHIHDKTVDWKHDRVGEKSSWKNCCNSLSIEHVKPQGVKHDVADNLNNKLRQNNIKNLNGLFVEEESVNNSSQHSSDGKSREEVSVS